MKWIGHFFRGGLVCLLVVQLNCGGSSSTTDSDDSDDDSPEEESGETDDTSDPGLPVTKLSYQTVLAEDTVQGTADHYDFIDNASNYRMFTETLHGTEVTVAVHNDVDESDDTVSTWSANVRDCWHEAWHVFGGYRYDRYAVLVRDPASSETSFSLSEAGVSINASDLETDDYEFVCHEMLHPWIGKLIAHEPDGTGNLFQAETWISEGAVVYTSFRILGEVIGNSEYRSGMNERFEDYDEARGTSLDLSMAELADLIGTDTSHEGVGVLYARGALISYLFDKELVAAGFSLDDLMAHLYENFGLMDTAWSQAELEAALAQITGTDFSGFFNTYLDTNAAIDVEGEFDSPLSH